MKDRGVFATLHRPDCTIRNKDKQATKTSSYRHSSYNPVVKTDAVIRKLDIIGESPKNELKQFDEAFAKYKEGKPDDRIDTEKYFDNLVAFIEESARGLNAGSQF